MIYPLHVIFIMKEGGKTALLRVKDLGLFNVINTLEI